MISTGLDASDLAGWCAAALTITGAMMTAANLGARITGWGFAVFTMASLAWVLAALLTRQPSLLATNGLLSLVNAAGIWRWLGRQARYEQSSAKAASRSRRIGDTPLFPLDALPGAPVMDRYGEPLGTLADAMLRSDNGQIAYVVVASPSDHGLGEVLRAISIRDFSFDGHRVHTTYGKTEFERLPELDDGRWPSTPSRLRPGSKQFP